MTSNKKLELLFVIESLQCGGAEKSLVTLLQNIDYGFFNVDLLLVKNEGEFLGIVPSEVNIIYKNVKQETGKLKLYLARLHYLILRKRNASRTHGAQLYWKSFGEAIKPQSKKYNIAVGYNQGFSTYFVASKIKAEKKIAWLNTDYLKAGYDIKFDYAYYKQYHTVVCVSQESEVSFNQALRQLGVQLPTMIIEDIIDGDVIKRLSENEAEYPPNSDGSIKILTVSRLAKAKGIDLAVQACKLLVDQGLKITWYIIGDGPERVNIEKMTKENNLEASFILLGFKSNPYAYIRLCDVYAQTSYFEGLGLTLIEAAILNKPIVTTNFTTAHSIIDHEKSGLICNPDPVEISEAIKRYLNDNAFKAEVLENLSRKKQFSKEESLKKINNLIKK